MKQIRAAILGFIFALGIPALSFAANPVQTKVGTWNGGATTATATFSSSSTAGNSVVVSIFVWPSGTTVSTITQGNCSTAYVKIAQLVDGANNGDNEMWWCPSLSTTGSLTVTANLSASANGLVKLIELSGISALDKSASSSTTSGLVAITVTASGANTNANDFVVASITQQYESTDPVLVHPPTSGYTDFGYDVGFSNYLESDMGYKQLSATETSAATWTWTNNNNAAAIIATFKPSAAGPGPAISKFIGLTFP